MPNLYVQDLRKRTIEYWNETGSKSQTAKTFGICRNSLNNWIALYQQQGDTKPKKAQPIGVKYIITLPWYNGCQQRQTLKSDWGNEFSRI